MNELYRESDEIQQKMIQSPGDGATDRDFPNCIWHSADGCTVWDCDFISRAEAKKRLYLNRKESDPK